MGNTSTVRDAKLACIATIEATIGIHGIKGIDRVRAEAAQRHAFVSTIYVVWDLGHAIEATLEIGVCAHPRVHGRSMLMFRVAWPSTTYSVSRAISAANLHTKIATLAATLDAEWDGVELGDD